MRIERRYTKQGQSPYADIEFRTATSEIRNPDGSIVFRLENIQVPAQFSQVAADILAQKYFRKAGVPAKLKPVEENTVPSWLWRQEADEKALKKLPEDERYGSEIDGRQVFDRLAGTWTYWGWKGGYFDTEEDAHAFYDELRYMLATQKVAPNSPQWFNTGLHWAYGIDGPSQGHFYVDFQTGELTRSATAYEHPQPHACFIQSVGDDLVNEGGIMDLWVREARLFKYGSGTGSNFSRVRGERRTAVGRRQVLRPDELPEDRRPGGRRDQVRRHHAPRGQDGRGRRRPSGRRGIHQLEGQVEEQKVAALVTGSKVWPEAPGRRHARLRQLRGRTTASASIRPRTRPSRPPKSRAAKKMMVPDNYIQRVIQFARQGFTKIEFPTYNTDWDSEAYLTVSGQNSNNSVRVTDGFLSAVVEDGEWDLIRPHHRQGGRRRSRPRTFGNRSAMPPGHPPIRACSSTPPSTTGTPARLRARSARPTRARSTCSWTTPPVTWRP